MSDDTPRLYMAREPIFPRRVKGRFRTLKWWILAVTLGIYYLTPWIRWDRGVGLPDQAVLVDMASRRFFFFWIEIWPHEFYFLAGLLIMAGIGLFLFTSALGRVWCGYTCPQTVWVDLFILIERWVEGDRNARIRLLQSKWNARKIRLRLVKWALWLFIAMATGGAWVFYFADAPTLFNQIWHFNAPFVAYASIAILTATTFIFGGFLREQVCIYMCPWPRIQAAMMDENSLTVAYRDWRGEPRGKHRKAENANQLGDCIDCNACVNVCPMGIDIRDGQQLECITCALCIDACDDIMDKVGKPRGLIDYMALTDETRERKGEAPLPVWRHIFRTRTIIYTALWGLVGIGLIFALFVRPDAGFTIAPVRNPTYVVLSDGSIRNTYELRVRNIGKEAREFELNISNPDLILSVEGQDTSELSVKLDATEKFRVYVVAPKGSEEATNDRSYFDFVLKINDTTMQETTVFNGKGE